MPRGRPKKETTYIKSMRVHKELSDFLESLENANKFIQDTIKSTPEFQKFLQEKRAQDSTPKLPIFDN